MKKIFLPLFALIFVLSSCDDTTDGVGASISDIHDNIEVATSVFNVTSESVENSSVLSRSSLGYLGKVKDSETGSYITNSFMTQFHTFENYEFPPSDSVASKIDGKIIADSCEVRIYFNNFYGDSLVSMKCTLHEFDHPLEENQKYYSTFSPIENGYIREGGIHKQKTYSIADYTIKSSDRWNNLACIPFSLNEPYTDSKGNTYNNYGTYIMQKFYEDKNNFHNSYTFIHNVCPGFYVESTSGIGSMAYINLSQLNVYFRYETTDSISSAVIDKYSKGDKTYYVYSGVATFTGTEEVIQKTYVSQDADQLKKLVDDSSCTYLKTPSGVITRLTLPVNEILKGHENDTLNAASLTLRRENNKELSKYSLPAPQTLLILPTDSVETFFANGKIADYRSSLLTTFTSSTNSYTFSNIASLIRFIEKEKNKFMKEHPGMTEEQFVAEHPNWNKVSVIPVVTSYSTVSGTQVLSKVTNDMSLSSTRLQGGKDNPEAIKLNVIYSKFK